MNFLSFPFFVGTEGLATFVQSDGKASVTNNVPKYANSSGVLLTDSGSKMTDKLSLDGTLPMTGALELNGNDVSNSGHVRPRDDNTDDLGSSTKRYKSAFVHDQLTGPTNTRSVDNILSNAGTGVAGNLATFTSDKVLADSGTALANLATVASLANYVSNDSNGIENNVAVFDGVTGKLIKDSHLTLDQFLPKSGGTMTGDIDMARNKINNVSIISADPIDDNNVIWGTGTTLNPPGNNIRNVALGYNHNTSGFQTVTIGDSATSVPGFNSCILIGGNLTSASEQSLNLGFGSKMEGDYACSIGVYNTLAGRDTYAFGSNITNSTENSAVVGAAGIVNIRANSTVCDLGTTDAPFQNLFLNANLQLGINTLGDGSGVIAIADASVVPTSNPVGGGILYVHKGTLRYRGTNGTITQMAPS